jgi:uncharacterized membrane protein YagU involved in acid resistance
MNSLGLSRTAEIGPVASSSDHLGGNVGPRRNLTGVLIGALQGATATVPMTLVMLIWNHYESKQQHRSLPPTVILEKLTGLDREFAAEGEPFGPNSLVAHFGFGASMGSLYEALPLRVKPQPLLFGLIVWVTNYAALLPAMGLTPPPWKERPARTIFNIAAHLTWGYGLKKSREFMPASDAHVV